MVRLDWHTPQEVRRVPITRHQLSGDVCGSSAAPREVTSKFTKSEPFVTVLSTAHLQQAKKAVTATLTVHTVFHLPAMLWLVANAREMQTFTFRAFRASKLTKAIYALCRHAQLPGAGLLDREGWPKARACRGRALPRPRGGLNTADSAPLWARDGPVRGWSMVRPKACHTAAARYPPHQSGTGPTRSWLGPTPVARTQHLEAVRLLSSWRRSRPVRLIHRGGRAEGDMRSSAVQPPHALLLSRTRRPWPVRVAGRL